MVLKRGLFYACGSLAMNLMRLHFLGSTPGALQEFLGEGAEGELLEQHLGI